MNKAVYENSFMQFFWNELSKPSFLASSNIHWSCADRERALIVEWSRQRTLCKDIVTESFLAKECLHEKKIRVPISSCDKGEIERTLSDFHFSTVDALYQHPTLPSSPNISLELENKWHLPELKSSENLDIDLDFPSLREWLAASHEGNLVILSLQNSRSNTDLQWQSFLRWYGQIDSPKQLAYRSPPQNNLSASKVLPLNFLPKIVFKQQNFPLGQQLCSYIEEWFLSRFLIQGRSLENLPRIEFECQIDSLAPRETHLEISRLPLPLISVNDRLFPFARRENILDPRIWNTLGGLQKASE